MRLSDDRIVELWGNYDALGMEENSPRLAIVAARGTYGERHRQDCLITGKWLRFAMFSLVLGASARTAAHVAGRRPGGLRVPHTPATSQPGAAWEGWAARSEDGTQERTFVLVGDDDRWLGLALVRLDDSNDGSAILKCNVGPPQARGRRGAGALCDACAAWATEHGCRQVTLQVVVDNPGRTTCL